MESIPWSEKNRILLAATPVNQSQPHQLSGWDLLLTERVNKSSLGPREGRLRTG